jgi:predicted Rossmann fold nucleotide-binding protein DprA/Smf involved in DNA uptake
MTMLDDQDLAALALTSRLVDAPAKPLSSRDYWALRENVEPSALHGMTAAGISSKHMLPKETAENIARLFDRAAALAIAIEKLDHAGIWTITCVGESYPERLRTRLGDAAPVVLHGVGDISLLSTDGVGVVGSRNVSAEGSEVAREIGEIAAKAGLPVISGAARGVDSDAMNAALNVGGQVVGVLADSLEHTVARRGIRQRVANGQICLVTPYPPSTPFSVGNAMGRNKIIYALARCTVVVASDHETGGTWAGATEALKHGYGRVASWTGDGAGPGNRALVERNASELSDMARLRAILDESVVPPPLLKDDDLGAQLTFGFGATS